MGSEMCIRDRVASAPKPSLVEDAIGALVSLGYSERDARASVSKVEDGLTLPEMIRQTLQLISSK